MAIPREMQAMLLERAGTPLKPAELGVPEPGPSQILIKVAACGVCRTDLHVVDGELSQPKLPLIPGHEIVGRVAGAWTGRRGLRHRRPGWRAVARRLPTGLASIAGGARESLRCPRFTGYQIDGGYADYAVADARYCFASCPTSIATSRPRRCSARG